MHTIKGAWPHSSRICFKVIDSDPTFIPVLGRCEFSVEPHPPATACWFSQMHRDREAPLRLKWLRRLWETKGDSYSSCRQLRSSGRRQEQRRSFPQSEAATKIISDVQYLGGRMTRHSSNPFFDSPTDDLGRRTMTSERPGSDVLRLMVTPTYPRRNGRSCIF
jgi:hypothetical protein